MPHRWTFTITSAKGSSSRRGSAEFTDEEWNIFNRYEEYVRELVGIQLLREGGPGKLKLHCHRDEGLSVQSELPPDDQVTALLHKLRPFVLQNEPTDFNKVRNILSRRIEDETIRGFLKDQKDVFHGMAMGSLGKISVNDVVINSDETLLKWLNAFEYHRDGDKRAEIKALHEHFPFHASRAIFFLMLYEKVRAICNVMGLVRTVLGKQPSFGSYPPGEEPECDIATEK